MQFSMNAEMQPSETDVYKTTIKRRIINIRE